MSTTFSVTRDEIIKMSLKECGAFGTGETPDTEDFTDASLALNIIIKSWIALGLPLWKITTVTVPLVANIITYQIGPTATGTGAVVTDRPLRVFDPFIRVLSSKQDTPLITLSRQEYQQFGFKTPTGSIPNSIYYQALGGASPTANGLLTIYPPPADALRSILLQAQVPINDVSVGTDVMDFPAECFQALKWCLAAEISGPYVSSFQKLQRIEGKADRFKKEMENWSVEEASLYFSPDTRNF